MISTSLDRFRAHAASIRTQPLFDARSFPVYTIIGSAALIATVLLHRASFTIDPLTFVGSANVLIIFLATGLGARRYGHDLLAGFFETLALTALQGATFLLIVIPLTALGGGFTDEYLARADAALGFDWVSFTSAITRYPMAVLVTEYVYHSMIWQPPIIYGILFFTKRTDRAWRTVLAGTIATAITCFIYAFFPAEGAFLHSGHSPTEFGRFIETWDFGPKVHLIKDAGTRHINDSIVGGLISFPSYHAAAAAMLAWAAWPTKVRWFFVPLNIGMAVSAIPSGAHYLVDILAGLAVAGFAIFISGFVGSSSGRSLESRFRNCSTSSGSCDVAPERKF